MPELAPRGAARLIGRHARGVVNGRLHFEVYLHLGGQVGLEFLFAE